MKTITLPCGETVPAMGLGTWHMGERIGDPAAEARALSKGLDLGITVIDTAEMYGRGGAERVVARAIEGRRDEVFLVSKVLPHNASGEGTIEACEKSLTRMEVEVIDLYLLHWPGRYPLADTVGAFRALQRDGKIRHWGVSNFDADEMEDLWQVPGGRDCQINQVLYNLSRRGVEWDLLPWSRDHAMPIMAYSPLEQGRLLDDKALAAVAARHGVTPAQVALAWTLREDGVMTIPKASGLSHVEDNRAAWDLVLDAADLAELDRAFPPPTGKRSLAIL
ncbi:MAG: aldo/keto reductase [Alphaproteobacteria bacterium]|jgi:diketogulonate reductase-like aldo/keto reductase|nr:aldo/keto reductase [Alphaproteobacteria bacterium]